VLGVEMKSTGEVACFGDTFYDAIAKALRAANYNLDGNSNNNAVLITVGGLMKKRLLPIVSLLSSLNFSIHATEHTAEFLIANGFKDVNVVYKISEPNRRPNIIDLLYNRSVNMIINIPNTLTLEKYVDMLDDEYMIRRKAVEMGIPVFTTIENATMFLKTLEWLTSNNPSIRPLEEYTIA
jgi:carbamoyl-phosphate synthase large subunit